MSEENTNPIEDFINSAVAGDYNSAGRTFNDILNQKTQAALDQEKIAVADQIFNGNDVESEEDLDDEEFEFDDEDLDDED